MGFPSDMGGFVTGGVPALVNPRTGFPFGLFPARIDMSAGGGETFVQTLAPIYQNSFRLYKNGTLQTNLTQTAPNQFNLLSTATAGQIYTAYYLTTVPVVTAALIGPVGSDPLFAYVKALLHGNGTNGGTTITDSTGLHTWPATGVAHTSTAQFLYNGSSILLNGTSEFFDAAPSADWLDGTNNFCKEWSCYFNASARQYMMDMGSGSANNAAVIITPSSGLIEIYNGSYLINSGSTPFNTGQWYRFCFERVANAWTFYVDGNAYVSNGSDSRAWGSNSMNIYFGVAGNGTNFSSAYYAECRLTQGQYRYNGNYTPTGPFPNF